MKPFLLVNANTVRPPVAPVGLEYAGHALLAAGIPLEVVDLAFEPDWKAALARATAGGPLAVGITVRNTDDCCFATGRSFLPWIAEVVAEAKRTTDAPVVLGGVGFSTAPQDVLAATGGDLGVHGEGEQALVMLARALAGGGGAARVASLPNLAYRDGPRIRLTPRRSLDLTRMPLPRRRLFDNPRYQREGAMVGIETKRGCSGSCVFCADPVAKGKTIRARPPSIVADEFEDLLSQGVTWFHLCDAEFNIAPLTASDHAREVCQALISRGLGERVRWFAYCSPAPFDRELALLMKRAGCAGINFGVDSLDDAQLKRLGKGFRSADVEAVAGIMKQTGFNYMFDLLFGGPGETEATVRTTIEELRRLDVPLAGAAVGVRVYRGTPLWEMAARGMLTPGLRGEPSSLTTPLFYAAPELGDDPLSLVASIAGDDPRFMVLAAPSAKGSYNYAGDEVLTRAIARGARGAYWDILRQARSS
ncbi:MAG: radical SAM protein [Chloroflexi bacterium]|nr:radical SAM protein [Chloroflexota bacterium]